jgi:hypothetical protein
MPWPLAAMQGPLGAVIRPRDGRSRRRSWHAQPNLLEIRSTWHDGYMNNQAGSQPRFDHPPVLDVSEPEGLTDAVVEVTRMREMRLAELRAFVDDLEREQGPVTEEELQAVRDEWLG